MKPFTSLLRARGPQFAAMVTAGSLVWLPGTGAAQTPAPAEAPHAHAQAAGQATAATSQDQELQKQIVELRAQLAKLQTALEQQKPSPQTPVAPAPANTGQTPGQRMMGEMGAMPPGGMRMGDKGEMGGGMGAGQGAMSGGGMGMMDMHKGEMGMPPEGMKMPEGMMMGEMGMGRMSGGSSTPASGGMTMGGATTSGGVTAGGGMTMGGSGTVPATSGTGAPRSPRSLSALPGVPGASHLYHIGSTGFFLDQSQITLTTDQQAALNRIKERALLERSNAERRIEQAEQELWALTGADQPDAAKVQAKVQEVEQLRTNERLAFIRAVGEATKLLTPEQRNGLLGTSSPKK